MHHALIIIVIIIIVIICGAEDGTQSLAHFK